MSDVVKGTAKALTREAKGQPQAQPAPVATTTTVTTTTSTIATAQQPPGSQSLPEKQQPPVSPASVPTSTRETVDPVSTAPVATSQAPTLPLAISTTTTVLSTTSSKEKSTTPTVNGVISVPSPPLSPQRWVSSFWVWAPRTPMPSFYHMVFQVKIDRLPILSSKVSMRRRKYDCHCLTNHYHSVSRVTKVASQETASPPAPAPKTESQPTATSGSPSQTVTTLPKQVRHWIWWDTRPSLLSHQWRLVSWNGREMFDWRNSWWMLI